MSNIDKDINRCKELIKEEHSNWIGLTNQDVVENVLNELENLQEDLKIHEETSFDFQAENIKLREELEETIKELNEKDIANKMFKYELEIKDKMIDKMAYRIVELVEKVYGNTHEQKYVIECFRRSI